MELILVGIVDEEISGLVYVEPEFNTDVERRPPSLGCILFYLLFPHKGRNYSISDLGLEQSGICYDAQPLHILAFL